ncbi:MAG: sulfatase-like hydrolase/transferase [Planctomycetota bacterium]
MCSSCRPPALALLLALSLAPMACGGGEPPRSAILVTLDTTRWDALSAHGVHPGVTPNLDALAAEGVLYEFAHTVAPITLPAHASMLTGLYPPRHTVRDNGFQPLPAAAVTLAEAAQAEGIQTAAFVASTVLDQAFGLDQGFATFSAPPRRTQQTTTHFVERTGTAVVLDALEWLGARDRARPFFLWVHLFDPHEPYTPPPKFLKVTEKNRTYYGEVAYIDEAVGILVDALRKDGTLAEATMIVVSDHGESLFEHQEATHSHFCYESTLKVPLLIRYPDGSPAGERSAEVVSVVDVYPTLLEAMGLSVASALDGVSLFHRAVPAGRGAYFEAYTGFIAFGWSPLAGWLDAKGKYIHSSAPEFYDLAADPDETKNVLPEGRIDLRPYRAALAAIGSESPLATDRAAGIAADVLEAIQGLGYAAAGPLPAPIPPPLQDTGLPSPASMVGTYRTCQQALALVEAGRLEEARSAFQKVLVENPRNWLALERLGLCYVNLQKPDEAIPLLRRVVAEGPQRAGTYYNLGICLFSVGQRDRNVPPVKEGIDALRQAVRLDTAEPIFLRDLAAMLRATGQTAEADECDRRLAALPGAR